MRIDKTEFGSVTINGKIFNNDMVVCWDGEIKERAKSHIFSKSELQELLLKGPEIVIVGTGHPGLVKIDPEAEKAARTAGIKLVAKPSSQAIQEFNKLVKNKEVIAVIHVTC